VFVSVPVAEASLGWDAEFRGERDTEERLTAGYMTVLDEVAIARSLKRIVSERDELEVGFGVATPLLASWPRTDGTPARQATMPLSDDGAYAFTWLASIRAASASKIAVISMA
jgi:hypothetical protein